MAGFQPCKTIQASSFLTCKCLQIFLYTRIIYNSTEIKALHKKFLFIGILLTRNKHILFLDKAAQEAGAKKVQFALIN
jgi:hypothetical protein